MTEQNNYVVITHKLGAGGSSFFLKGADTPSRANFPGWLPPFSDKNHFLYVSPDTRGVCHLTLISYVT